MKKYQVRVTSECISTNGRPYNSDKFEGENVLPSDSAKQAIEQEARALLKVGSLDWYDDNSAVIKIKFDDGGEKHYFFDACEVTE